jgi:hypothetical protein
MSLVKVSGNASGTGTLTIAAPNTNSDRTLTLPDGTGTFTVNGINSNIVSGTAVASTSGTSIDFTSIPSWVKRITVMFSGLSTNGSSNLQIQIGAGSVTTSGYTSYAVQSGTAGSGGITATSGFILTFSIVAASIQYGSLVLTNLTSNTWVSSLAAGGTDSSSNPVGRSGGGSIALGGTLDRVRITTVNGTDTFDAGSINILYE